MSGVDLTVLVTEEGSLVYEGADYLEACSRGFAANEVMFEVLQRVRPEAYDVEVSVARVVVEEDGTARVTVKPTDSMVTESFTVDAGG